MTTDTKPIVGTADISSYSVAQTSTYADEYKMGLVTKLALSVTMHVTDDAHALELKRRLHLFLLEQVCVVPAGDATTGSGSDQ